MAYNIREIINNTEEVRIDRLDLLTCEEHLGAIRKLTRKARIVGFITAPTSYLALNAVLAKAGIPAPGSFLDGDANSQLVLVSRIPTLLDDRSAYDVVLNYEHILDGSNQNFSGGGNPFGSIFGKTKCSVQQKKTNFYREKGVGNKKQITVAHRWPSSGPNRDQDNPGVLHVQGGEVDVFIPQRTYHCEGYYDTIVPWVIADFLIATVNNTTWNNKPAREWMCTEVSWEMLRLKPRRYRFGFEFQHNPDGWDPQVVFIDPRTQRPPQELVPGFGYKTIVYYKPVNFNQMFNGFFEGWQQNLNPFAA